MPCDCDRLMIVQVEYFDDLAVDLDGVGDPDLALLGLMQRQGDGGLTIAGGAGHE